MIFYFSATGNSLDAARTIAQATNDTLTDLGAAYRTARFNFQFRVQQGENLGFVFPVHAWTTPGIVDDFVRKASFVTENGNRFSPGYCYCVITCGNFVGNTASYFAKLLKRYQGITLDASYSVKTVGNCVYLYDMPSLEKQRALQHDARRQARAIGHAIQGKRMGHAEKRNPIGRVMSAFTGKEGKYRPVDKFHVDADACVGCGQCAMLCPTNTISIEQGHPVWSGDLCTRCLACLHRCPQHATQYGDSTAERGRYQHPSLKTASAGIPAVRGV